MKTLIIAAHPHIAQSVVNKCWLDKLAKHPDRFTVHRLYTAYPDSKIDIAREQALVEAHGGIVFQFPVYWFNCPPLLKQWFDDVLTYGWAYGSAGRAFAGRKTGIAVSLGAHPKQVDVLLTLDSPSRSRSIASTARAGRTRAVEGSRVTESTRSGDDA